MATNQKVGGSSPSQRARKEEYPKGCSSFLVVWGSNTEGADGVRKTVQWTVFRRLSAAAMPQGDKAPKAIVSLTARQKENPFS